MRNVALKQGQPVYVRSYSTRRAAVGELLALVQRGDREWGEVRLITEWHNWDGEANTDASAPQEGEVLRVESYRLESIRA
jgi:hypothetical protein